MSSSCENKREKGLPLLWSSYGIMIESHIKFGLKFKTDSTHRQQEGKESLTTHIVRLSRKCRVGSQAVLRLTHSLHQS